MPSVLERRRTAAVFAVLILILGYAFFLRFNAFWLPHWKGDQNHYVALAMKLDAYGMDGYNLREIKLGTAKLDGDPPVTLVYCRPGERGSDGEILKALKFVGQGYYDEPLHMRAPLFSYALLLSHRFFASEAAYGVCSSNLGERVKSVKPAVILKTQFWAAIVPLFFNFFVILGTFFLGWRLFGDRVGLAAAFLMATNPVSLTTSYRVLSEDMTLFFILAAFILFMESVRKDRLIGFFLAGALAGLAVLTRQTAGVVVFIAAVYLVSMNIAGFRKENGFYAALFDRRLILFTAALVLVSAPWFIRVVQVYGTPFHAPTEGMQEAVEKDITGWFTRVAKRPHPILFFTVYVAALFPLFALVLLTLKKFFAAAFDRWRGGRANDGVFFLWLWILGFYVWITHLWNPWAGDLIQEHRYFYPAYPAIAILSATVLNEVRLKIGGLSKKPWLGDAVILAALAANAWWGIPQAMKVIYENNMLL